MKSGYIYLFLLIVCVLVYADALNNGFLFDDKFFIVQNPYIRDIRFLPQLFRTDIFHFSPSGSSYYRPLQALSYTLDYFFWGLNPLGYRLTNIVIHSLNSFLVYLLIYFIFKDKIPALLTGILFCIHPVQAGVVTIIGGRSNILEMMFMLSSLTALAGYFLYRRRPLYVLSVSAFLPALLSREGALLLPFFAAVCIIMSNNNSKKRLFSLLPFIAIGGIYLFLRNKFMPSEKLNFAGVFSLQNVSNFFYLCRDYFRQLILPYGFLTGVSAKGASLLPALNVFASILIAYIIIRALIFRDKIIIFGLAFYLIGLLPVLNLAGTISFFGPIFSEPYVYPASAGFFLIIAYLVLSLRSRFPRATVACVALIVSAYSGSTIIKNTNYKNELTFYNYVLNVDGNNTIARLNLGNIYYAKGELSRARREAEFVLGREPRAWDAYLLLGNISGAEGNSSQAAEFYRKAIAANPKSAQAYNNLGIIYQVRGEQEKAYDSFKKAVEINPELVEALRNLSNLLIGKGLYYESMQVCSRILELYPEDADAMIKLGISLAEAGESRKAEIIFKEAIRINPASTEAMKNLGALYANSGDFDKAILIWSEVLKTDPGDEQAARNIERARSLRGR
ncbi:MAG: tetratricopeptide repeat protein [Candidatus Omnitrophota bacterium]